MQPADTPQSSSHEHVPPPAPVGRTILFASLALAAGLGLTGWFDASNLETCTGYLMAHSTAIIADRDGRLLEVLVEETSVAQIGQPIVVLSDEKLEASLIAKQQEVQTLRAQLDQARAKADVLLAWRLRNLDAEIFDTRLKSANYLKAQLDRQVEQHAWQEFLEHHYDLRVNVSPDSSSKSLLHQRRLRAESRVRAMLEYEAAQNAAEVSAVQLRLCEGRLKTLEQLKTRLAAKTHCAARVDLAESQLSSASAALDSLEQQKNKLTLTTSAYGTVGLYRKRVGESVARGDTIVEVLDEDRRFLVVQIPSKRLPGLVAGKIITLEFPGGEMRKGIVRQIPSQADRRPEGNGNRACSDSQVSLRIDPTDRLWPKVPIGSAVEVRLRTSHRTNEPATSVK